MTITLRFVLTAFALLSAASGVCAQDAYYTNLLTEMDTSYSLTGGTLLYGTTETAVQNTFTDTDLFGHAGALEKLTVTGQPFTKTTRMQTNTYPRVDWDVKQKADKSSISVASGERVLVAFWVRGDSFDTTFPSHTRGLINAQFKYGSANTLGPQQLIAVTGTWKRYFLKYTAGSAISQLRIEFNQGFQKQRIEIGGFAAIKYPATGGTLPATVNSDYANYAYPGRSTSYDDTGINWLNDAKTRIENTRKANFDVRVKDSAGNAISGASVRYKLINHRFRFGAQTAAGYVNSTTDGTLSNDRMWVDMDNTNTGKRFNTAVLGNDMKWDTWLANKPGVNSALTKLNNTWNIDYIRGHTLVWGDYSNVPSGSRTFAAVRAHIADEVGYFAPGNPNTSGKLGCWDVLNETFARRDWENVAGSLSAYMDEVAEWYRIARNYDGTAAMYLNDNDIIARGGLAAVRTSYYTTFINGLKSRLAATGDADALNGFGFQMHTGDAILTPPERIKEILDYYANLGLRLQVTEYDALFDGNGSTSHKAAYLRDWTTLMFSHPNVDGVTFWHPNPTSDAPNVQLFNYDAQRTLSPAGVELKNLIYSKWWTDTTLTTDSSGRCVQRGFKGKYDIVVTSGATTKTFQVGYLDDNSVVEINFTDHTATITDIGGAAAVWKFNNGGWNFVAPGTNDCTLVNGPVYSSTDKQEGSHSLQFDGVNDYANPGTINVGNQFSIEAWVKWSGSSIKTIMANGGGGNGNGFRLVVNRVNTTDGRVRFETGNGTASNTAESTANAVPINTWTHVGVAVDRTAGTARIWVNGVDVTEDTSIRTDFATNQAINLGRMTTGTSYHFTGKLDYVWLHKRYENFGN
jgi:GH35 family endo-1,4-beta-xylanase